MADVKDMAGVVRALDFVVESLEEDNMDDLSGWLDGVIAAMDMSEAFA